MPLGLTDLFSHQPISHPITHRICTPQAKKRPKKWVCVFGGSQRAALTRFIPKLPFKVIPSLIVQYSSCSLFLGGFAWISACFSVFSYLPGRVTHLTAFSKKFAPLLSFHTSMCYAGAGRENRTLASTLGRLQATITSYPHLY